MDKSPRWDELSEFWKGYIEQLHSDHEEATKALSAELETVKGERGKWRQNVEVLLSDGDPDNIRCREGGGPEDQIASLVLTVTRTRGSRNAAEAQLAEALHLLGRYRTETPLGNQPHMITHEVDDFARRALSSGGKQEPVAYRVHAPEDEHYGTGPDRLQFHPLAPHDLNNGYRQTPLYTRPSEQAVTEAMVDKVLDAAGDYMGKQYGNTALHHPTDRARIKAAMEAGHD